MPASILFARSAAFARWLWYFSVKEMIQGVPVGRRSGFCVIDDYGNSCEVKIMQAMYSMSIVETTRRMVGEVKPV